MRVKIFETTENDPRSLNEFLAQDTTRHYVTVVYHTLEQAPEQS